MEYTAVCENYDRLDDLRRKRRMARRRRAAKRRELLLALIASAVIMIFVMVKTSTVSATPAVAEQKARYYTSITVDKNDTLWDIAGRYYNASVENRRDYIANIKKVNGLSGDTIRNGNKLVIYYWVPETQNAEK